MDFLGYVLGGFVLAMWILPKQFGGWLMEIDRGWEHYELRRYGSKGTSSGDDDDQVVRGVKHALRSGCHSTFDAGLVKQLVAIIDKRKHVK